MASRQLSTRTNYNSNPFHIYYDINMINNDTTGNLNSVPLRFQETRNQVILQNPSEYFMSVVRFSLDTASLPLLIPEVDTLNGNTNANTLVYQFAYGKYGQDAGANVFNVTFRPQDLTAQVPTVSFTNVSNPYYYIYNYQAFIDMINDSLLVNIGNTNRTPQFVFNKETNKASIYFPQASLASPTWGGQYSSFNTSPYFLYMNAPLFQLFSSFNAEYCGQLPNNGSPSTVTTNYGWYRLTVPNVNNTVFSGGSTSNINNIMGFNNIDTSTAKNGVLQGNEPYVDAFNYFSFLNTSYYTSQTSPPIWTVLSQDYPTTPLWSPVTSIVFTTGMMPICSELTGIPVVYGTGAVNFNQGDNANFVSILTDIEVPLIRGDEFKPQIFYEPKAEYRLIDLQSNNPVNSIEINVFWRDQFGNLHQFYLDTGCNATLKIMFRKKEFNTPRLENPI